jgi:hypothetical protein
MAGVYADIPGTRFALDQDGTVFKWRNFTTGSAWTDVTGSLAEIQKVNAANYVDIPVNSLQYPQLVMAFPEARSINGLYVHFGGASDNRVNVANFTWEQSSDTTDGTDGTWSTFTVTFANFSQHDNVNDAVKPFYRSDIATVSLTNVKGIRVRYNDPVYGATTRLLIFHVYGSRPTTGVNRLAFWHPTLDQAISAAYLDFGDTPQGTVITRQFRVKNLAAALTANSVSVAASDLLPEYTAGELQVSTDNTTYANSIDIGNLNASTISSVLYVRMTVPGAESPSQRSARLLVTASSWT